MEEKLNSLELFIRQSVRFLAIIGGATLLGLMLLTVYAVIMRYVFNSPLLGALDYARVGLVVVTFMGLGYCGLTGGHIAVDFIGSFAPAWVLRVTDTFIRLSCAVLIGFMAWQGLRQGVDAFEMGEGTNEVEIPLFPFFGVVAFGCSVYAVVLVVQALRAARGAELDDRAE